MGAPTFEPTDLAHLDDPYPALAELRGVVETAKWSALVAALQPIEPVNEQRRRAPRSSIRLGNERLVRYDPSSGEEI